MKNLISTLSNRMLAFVLLAAWNALPVEAASFSIDPSSLNGIVGQTFNLGVRISGASDLYAFGFDLGFDPTVLSANSTNEGAFLPAGGDTLFIGGDIDNAGGTISTTGDSLQSATPGVNGDGILATVSFTALAAGSSSISLFNPTLLDSNLSDIAVDGIQNANVGVTAVPIPAAIGLFGSALSGLLVFIRRKGGAT